MSSPHSSGARSPPRRQRGQRGRRAQPRACTLAASLRWRWRWRRRRRVCCSRRCALRSGARGAWCWRCEACRWRRCWEVEGCCWLTRRRTASGAFGWPLGQGPSPLTLISLATLHLAMTGSRRWLAAGRVMSCLVTKHVQSYALSSSSSRFPVPVSRLHRRAARRSAFILHFNVGGQAIKYVFYLLASETMK